MHLAGFAIQLVYSTAKKSNQVYYPAPKFTIKISAMSHIPSSLNGDILPQVSGSEILHKERKGWHKMEPSSHHNSNNIKHPETGV